MNLAKMQVKIDILKEMGAECAKKATEAANTQLRQEGARDALKEAAEKIGALGAFLDQDIESGLVAKVMKDEMEMEKYLKRYFKRAAGVCISLSDTANVTMIAAGGKKKAHELDGEYVRAQAESELAKLNAYEKAIKDGTIRVEDEGGSVEHATKGEAAGFPTGHPGLPMKAQRQAEEGQKKPSAKKSKAPATKKPTRKKAAPKSTAKG